MIVMFKNYQDKGKSLGMLAVMFDMIFYHGYNFSEVVGNVKLKIAGTTYLNIEQIREYVKDIDKYKIKHKIILLDEIDSIFPHRFFMHKEQTESLIGLWKDEKYFNYYLCSNHMSLGCDSIIRDSTQIDIMPEYVENLDKLYLIGYNSLYNSSFCKEINNISRIFKYYDRWE